MDGEGGDDEAAESAVIFVGLGADKPGIGAGGVAVSQFAVLGIAVLPESKAFWVGHLRFAFRDGLREGVDDGFAVLGDRTPIRMHNRVCMRSSITSAHNDAFVAREFATEIIKGKGGFYMCHIIPLLLRCCLNNLNIIRISPVYHPYIVRL